MLAFALASGVAVAAEAAPASKTFRDWIAGCDNLMACTALSLPAEAAGQVAILKLERPGGPSGAVTMSVRIRVEKLKAPLAVRLTLDGAAFPAAGKTLPASLEDVETAVVSLSATETETLITAARKATRLGVALAGKTYQISLAGSVAAMLWIDEQQGRLNTNSALIRKGTATTVPNAPALPVITARATDGFPAPDKAAVKSLAAALRKHLKQAAPDSCDDTDATSADSDGAWTLDGRTKLVGLLCSRGAYNMTTGFWIVPDNDATKARKVAFPQLDGKTDNELVNAEYDPATGQVGFFSKARGVGDCGASGGYAWTGSAFVLTRFDEMGECRGLPTEDWLTLYRSEVKVAR